MTSFKACGICIATMNARQKTLKRVELLYQADRLLGEALCLGGYPCFGESVVNAQTHIEDAIVWADRR